MEEDLRRESQIAANAYYKVFGKEALQHVVFVEYAATELYAIPLEQVQDFIDDVNARVAAGTP